jgi:phage minor structural protein
MIHMLDRQTERILDVLVNQSDRKIYWDTKMTEGLENNVLIFEFRMLADSPAAKHIIPKNKLTAQDQDGFHRLFIIDSVETSHDANGKILFVSALGDHIELASEEPIPPQTLPGQTAETAVQFVLANTRYQTGQIDFAGSRTITFDTYTDPLGALQKISSEFELELRFRVNVNPDGTITRIVDLLKPDSVFDGKEIVFGKDMTGIRRKENTENICTRLVGIGPADEDGNIVTFASVNGGKIYVEDEEAFQRWNNAGRHIWGIFEYQPEGDTDVTPQEVLDATKKEMEKRKSSVVEWEVQAAALEQVIGLEHERVRVGMNVRIKDEALDPPIYLEARVLETEMPELDDSNGNFSYTFGNYREVKVVVPAEVKAIQKILFHNSGGWSAAKVKADIAQQIANEAKADVEAANARIDNLVAIDITALHAEIENLEAIKANVEDLFSINAQIENLQAGKANISDLIATNARIDNLVANDLSALNASIANLQAGKANITDLNATNARVGALEADVGSINTLLAGNLGAENFQAGAIYAGSGVIAQGAIGDAEISNLNASKINAGILNTALVTIQGANGRMKIANNRLQVFANKTDGSLYERVSLGDVNGDGSVYGLRIRGADGQTVLLDENGVKREGITDGSITNEKIANDANISGTKLDIASVVTEINEGTTTIQSSKIFYNGKTLDVQLGNMVNTVNAQGQTITNHETRITATEQGLATKVSVSQYQQDQSALSTQLSQMSTQIQQQANQIALKADASNVYTKSQVDGQFSTVNQQITNLSAQLTIQADQIASKVSRTEFESLQIGGRNLLRNTDFRNGLNNWSNWGTATREVVDLNGKKWVHLSQNDSNRWRGVSQVVLSIKPSTTYTVSFIAYSQNNSVMTVGFHQRLGNTIVTQNWQTFTLTNSPKKYSYTFTTTGSSIDQFNFMIGNDQSPFDIYITDIKLELGNRATDWTPAPEDVQGQIDVLGSRMTTAETSITQLSNQIALKANQSTVDTLTGQVSSLQAQLTVQAGQIATKVEKNGVISAINQTAEQIKIQASKISLQGAVTVLSDITGNLGTINAGTINGIEINGTVINGSEFHSTGENGEIKIKNDSIVSIQGEGDNQSIATLSSGAMQIEQTFRNMVWGMQLAGNQFYSYFDDGTDTGYCGLAIDPSNGITFRSGRYAAQKTYMIIPNSFSGTFDIRSPNEVRMNVGGSNTHIFQSDGGIIFGANGRVLANDVATYIQSDIEVRATKFKSSTLVPMRASSFPTGSLEKYKQDIHVWEESALEKIRQATIYEYYLKSELEQGVHRKRQGLVIGEGYNTPSGVIDGDGVEQYLMNTWSWKAIQELDTEQRSMKERIAWLELENQYLKQKIQQLEAMVS